MDGGLGAVLLTTERNAIYIYIYIYILETRDVRTKKKLAWYEALLTSNRKS